MSPPSSDMDSSLKPSQDTRTCMSQPSSDVDPSLRPSQDMRVSHPSSNMDPPLRPSHPSEGRSLTSHHDEAFPLSRKRPVRSSPLPSQLKLSRSPLPKLQRRDRTGTETAKTMKHTYEIPHPEQQSNPHPTRGLNIDLSDFLMDVTETDAIEELQKELYTFMLHRAAANGSTVELPYLNVQDFLSVVRVTHTQQSNIVYLQVMDAKADSKDTIMELLHGLRERFIEGMGHQWLVVEGDGKFYEILKSLQFEYVEEFSWIIPYPGDWHMLMNFQAAIIKPYYDAGLRSLAMAAGYPAASIQSTSQFKQTHSFILEAWEAVYRVMLAQYIDFRDQQGCSSSTNLLEEISDYLQSIPSENFSHVFNQNLVALDDSINTEFDDLKAFICERARHDDTWRFWVQFTFTDAMAYVGLFLAMRSGD